MLELSNLLVFWAKKKGEPEVRYPLLCHMIDTASVTQEMWNTSLHSGFRSFLSKQLNLNEEEAGLYLSFWAGLHDLGKASPGFQSKSEAVREELRKRGFSLSDGDPPGHGLVTTRLLNDYLKDSMPASLARQVAVSLGGHHGEFPRSAEINSVITGSGIWASAQREIYDQYTKLVPKRTTGLLSVEPNPSFFMCLAGITSVADWIASNESLFPYNIQHSLEAHPQYAQQQARQALTSLGWTGWQPPSASEDFKKLFPFIKTLRPLQREALALSETLGGNPELIIIEAPMGEGKTEAAMYLADSWEWGCGQKGSYFALPTMATSDQMFGRVGAFLKRRYRDQTVNLMLLHGHAALSAEFDTLRNQFAEFVTTNISGDKGYDGAKAQVIASEWFTYRKRGLLAPFGVGTIDQVLLAVLQTRHVFVRLFGLANKTVIIDEVHAYDAYMTTLLERLLEWLAALGSSVVLLSATLPRQRRDALLKAYLRGKTKKDVDIPSEVSMTRYPRIAWTTSASPDARRLDTSPQSTKTLHLNWLDGELPENGDDFELGKQLKQALAQGGCAAIICNTVDRAQKVYTALKPYFPESNVGDGYPELDLLHARYTYNERRTREIRTLCRFGKKNTTLRDDSGKEITVQRPKRAVLVSTQVIEQSLDIDFDLMVTEMAPVDLLLQRAGRLHRHERETSERHGLVDPTLWICQPETREEVPHFGGGTEVVYDYHVLLRTWLALKSTQSVGIPGEVEGLIEKVYGEQKCPPDQPEEIRKKWEESKEKHEFDIQNEREEARERWIKWPGYSGEIWRLSAESREEDDPRLHEAHQALTRLTGLTVNVLCLYSEGTRSYLDIDLSYWLDTKACPNTELTKRLLTRAIVISRQGLVQRIIESGCPIPVAWREQPLLRHHYILFFSQGNRCQFDRYVLNLDEERGLIIENA